MAYRASVPVVAEAQTCRLGRHGLVYNEVPGCSPTPQMATTLDQYSIIWLYCRGREY